MRFAELPRPLRGYLLGLAFGLAPLAYGLTRCPPPNSALLTAMLVLCAALLSTWRLELRIVQGKMTLVFAVVCLALLLQGGVAAVGCAVLGAVIGSLVRPQPGGWRIQRLHLPLYKHWFNAVNGALSCGAGLLPYYTLAALDLPFGLSPVLGLAAFAVLYFTLNTVAVAVAISLQQGLRWTSVWRENFAWTAPGFLASASLAGVIQLLFSYLQAWALLFLAPVYMIYYAYRLHLERVQKDLEHIQELNEFNQAVILSLATAIDAKDRYTCSHINRVREYGLSLARAAGLDGPELQAVATAALVHDVGKLGIPDHILSKPGKLTAEEYRRMQDHVTIGAEILAPVPFKFPVVEVVLTHHERWDGRGYPRGLQGEEIPIGGRIISIVDVFDALTSNRPYRRAMTHEEAMQALRDGAGKQFDPRLVELFFKILPEAGERIARMEAEQAAQGGEEQQVSEATDAFVRIGQAAAEMAAVCDVAQALAEQTTERDVLSLIADRALSLMPADTAIVYLRCPDRGELRAAAIQGKYRDRLEGMAVALGEGVAGTVAETQQPMVNVSAVADIARRFRPDENLELSSATAVPLVQGPEQLGVLAVYTQAYSVLSAHHLNVLNILAEHAAATLQNLRWLELNREMAFTDPLTGLANSRCLVRQLERSLHAPGGAEGGSTPFGLMMLDLDGFKEVNDTFGHLRGDELLRQVGEALLDTARPGDLVCRYAGDEFVLLLPDAVPEHVARVVERVRQAVEALPPVEGQVRIRVSLGAASYPEDGEDARSLLHAADQRMYEDKFRRRQGADGELPGLPEPEPSLA